MANPPEMDCVYTVPPGLQLPQPIAPGVQIFVGSWLSATDPTVLADCGITSVLNVAYDLDDQPVNSATAWHASDPQKPWQAAYDTAAPSGQVPGHYRQQYAKVGLIDGPGDVDTTLVAAVFMADQLLCFAPQGPSPFSYGNLLIHCVAGQSRSVTVAALYIYYKFGLSLGDSSWNDFPAVYARVQAARSDSNPPPPTPGMQAAAARIVSRYSGLFPVPVTTA